MGGLTIRKLADFDDRRQAMRELVPSLLVVGMVGCFAEWMSLTLFPAQTRDHAAYCVSHRTYAAMCQFPEWVG